MRRTALLFVLANLASIPVLGYWLGFSGFFSALWFLSVLETAPQVLLPMLFIWVPVWLWIAAIRRAWHGSLDTDSPEYVPGQLFGQARMTPDLLKDERL